MLQAIDPLRCHELYSPRHSVMFQKNCVLKTHILCGHVQFHRVILCLVSAVFLPALVNPDECKGKSKELNLPLCLAWSSSARNHFIPLVGVQGGEQDHLLCSNACVVAPTDTNMLYLLVSCI